MSVTYRLDNLEAINPPVVSRLGTKLTGFSGWWDRTVSTHRSRVVQLGAAVAIVLASVAGVAWQSCSALASHRTTGFAASLGEPDMVEMETLMKF